MELGVHSHANHHRFPFCASIWSAQLWIQTPSASLAVCSERLLLTVVHALRVACMLDQPELKQIDQIRVKQSHTAATTFILEAARHGADNSAIR